MEQFASSVFLSRVFSNTAIRASESRGGCIPDYCIILSNYLKETAIYQIANVMRTNTRR